ncbi:hypothetical protein DFH94DRAFT_853760 [Russula ochroleuca]|uniref:F-box domain-containing protein n=1 Tax=Russula ochroleuca TaxID=152965 RepID=A0A9P5MWN6_9AGAM|nr:hypothetical protein DFH94DRAFT_853760 [Russula ochroleuca]
MIIDNLPDEVLLEIFDLYRQTFGDQPSSERVWNNKNGWFKLAHVCHNWRSVVLASPSRLRLRLYFASNTPTRAAAPERLSHLPIIVDYSNVIWKASAQKRLISALRYPDRVCRIAIRGSYDYDVSDKITELVAEALDLPFPALESLELYNITSIKRVFLSTSLMTSIQSLRHLRLDGMPLTSLSPLLSVTRSLVDLALSIDRVFSAEGPSLLTHLQHMPHLRNLRVSSNYCLPDDKPPTTSILLPELTSFRFVGECTPAGWFVAGLDAPSLREFHISVTDYSRRLHIPYLTKFIRAMGIVFVAARLTISGPSLRTDLFAWPHRIDDQPSKIFTVKTQFAADPGSELSAMLTTVEDIFLSSPVFMIPSLSYEDPVTWRKFFEEFRNVKILRLLHGLEMQVAEILRQPAVNAPPPQEAGPDATTPSGTPIFANRSQFIFPSLEEIVLYAGTPDRSTIGETERASMLKSFGPFVTARDEVGLPVKVFWSTDGELPRYFMTDSWY